MDEYINILNLPNSFDLNDLKRAYRKMVMKFHPDCARNDNERAEYHEKMKQINAAYEALKEYLKINGKYTKPEPTPDESEMSSDSSQTEYEEYYDSAEFTESQYAYDKEEENESDNYYEDYEKSDYNAMFADKNLYKSEKFSGRDFKMAFVILFIIFLCAYLFNNKPAKQIVKQPEIPSVVEESYNEEKEISYEKENIWQYDEKTEYVDNTEVVNDKKPVYNTKVYTKDNNVTKEPVEDKIVSVQKNTDYYKPFSDTNRIFPADYSQPNSNSRDRLDWVDPKNPELFKYTDLSGEVPYSITQPKGAWKYAQSYVAPKLCNLWKNFADSNLNDSMTVDVYIDLYGKLKYFNIVTPPKTQRMADDVRSVLNSASPYPELYYVKLGGDVKLTYKIDTLDGQLNVQTVKAQNILW